MSNNLLKILLVRGSQDLLSRLSAAFAKSGLAACFSTAASLAEAARVMEETPPDLIIAADPLPDGPAHRLLPGPGGEPRFPVIILAGQGDERAAASAIKAGAMDYIPDNPRLAEELPGVAARVMAEWERRDELARAQKALAQNEQLMRRTFESAAVGMAHVDLSGKVMRVNGKLCEILGYKREEMLALSFQEVTHPEDLASNMELFEQTLAGQRDSYTIQKRYLRKDGREVWASLSAALVRDEAGAPLHFIAVVGDITAQKEAEKALRLSEEKFAKTFKASPAWVTVTTLHGGVFLETNDTFSKITGFSREETVGQSSLALGLWVNAHDRADALRDFHEHGPFKDRKVKLKFRDGRVHHMLWSVEHIEYQGQDCWVNLMVDVSESLETQRALVESEDRFRQLFEQMVSGFALHEIITDQNGKPVDYRFLDVNPAFEKMTGLSRKAVVGKTVKALMPGTEEEWIEDYGRVALTGQPRHLERFTQELGKFFEVMAFSPKQGQFAVTFSDVTERNRAVEALAASEARLKTLINASKDAIITLDMDRRLTSVNPAFTAMFGWSAEEAAGRSVQIFHQDQAAFDNFGRRAYPTLEQRGFWRGEWLYKRKDGQAVPVETVLTALRDNQGRPQAYMAVMRDITERLAAEEERKRLESQLRQAQKMEAIGTLAGGIAHDFNNILAAIIGYSELILSDLREGSVLADNARQVLKAGIRARDLVRQILTFSRQQEHERRPITISSVVKEALKLLRSSLPTTINIETRVDPDLGAVVADPTQVHQLLMNLCTNASHAMGGRGGNLVVSLARVDLSLDDAILKPPAQPGPYQVLSVSDNGEGMDATVMERIFEPYFTTKGRGEGTGLGLAVVHGIVKSCDGFISVYSEPGQGSTFRVYLPQSAEADQSEPAPLAPLTGGGERILIVDDEEAVADMLRLSLTRLGYKVTAQTDSRAALAAFRAAPREYDLVISDQTMPEMTGLELLQSVKLIRPGLPTILCTGFSAQVNQGVAQQAGIEAFIMKPVVLRELAQTVRELLDRD